MFGLAPYIINHCFVVVIIVGVNVFGVYSVHQWTCCALENILFNACSCIIG